MHRPPLWGQHAGKMPSVSRVAAGRARVGAGSGRCFWRDLSEGPCDAPGSVIVSPRLVSASSQMTLCAIWPRMAWGRHGLGASHVGHVCCFAEAPLIMLGLVYVVRVSCDDRNDFTDRDACQDGICVGSGENSEEREIACACVWGAGGGGVSHLQ